MALVLLAGCASEDAPDEPTVCAERAGLYRVTGKARSGTCGPWPEQILNLSDDTATAGCVYRLPRDAVSCRVNVDSTCPLKAGGTVTLRGVASWSADASSGSATMTMVIDAPLAACTGSYDLTYTRP